MVFVEAGIVRIAVFSCLGLGDGLISLVLSHNLAKNGFEVTTFHPSLKGLQEWFPNLPIEPLEGLQTAALRNFDKIFLFHEKTPRMLAIQQFCQKELPEKLTILNPIATRRTDYPFWEGGRFDGRRTFVDNLARFCSDGLKLKTVTSGNGIVPPPDVILHRFPKRVIFHPTSSRESKNWLADRFESLASKLEEEGWDPCFLLTREEKERYPTCRYCPEITGLSSLATFVAESGAMVGNDSGVGHLASCLGLPTVTICRNQKISHFWKPGWARGEVLTPSVWVPNLKWMRWRDQYWKHFISVQKVLEAFRALCNSSNSTL